MLRRSFRSGHARPLPPRRPPCNAPAAQRRRRRPRAGRPGEHPTPSAARQVSSLPPPLLTAASDRRRIQSPASSRADFAPSVTARRTVEAPGLSCALPHRRVASTTASQGDGRKNRRQRLPRLRFASWDLRRLREGRTTPRSTLGSGDIRLSAQYSAIRSDRVLRARAPKSPARSRPGRRCPQPCERSRDRAMPLPYTALVDAAVSADGSSARALLDLLLQASAPCPPRRAPITDQSARALRPSSPRRCRAPRLVGSASSSQRALLRARGRRLLRSPRGTSRPSSPVSRGVHLRPSPRSPTPLSKLSSRSRPPPRRSHRVARV